MYCGDTLTGEVEGQGEEGDEETTTECSNDLDHIINELEVK